MLGIPYLSTYLKRVIQIQAVSDTVDRLNYYVTSYMLAFFAFAISCKQYFGSPIQCWTPKEFSGTWDRYAENYCFIANSYHVPMEHELPTDPTERDDQISYYRWVPIVLALQAVMFYMPNYLWNSILAHTAINPVDFLTEAERIKKFHGKEREQEIEHLASNYLDAVSVFQRPRKFSQNTQARSGRNAVYLYLMTKALYFINLVVQIWLVDRFLGGKFISWGMININNIVTNSSMADGSVFPRVIYCDFLVRRLADVHRYTVQCVIMMNMINEKVYLLLYIWFMMLFVLTAVNFFYYCAMLLLPFMRHRLLLIGSDDPKGRRKGLSKYRSRFVNECAMPDGVLLLQFVKEHVGGRIAYELTTKILALYTSDGMSSFKAYSDTTSENEKHPLSEKSSPSRFFGNGGANAPPYEERDTLKLEMVQLNDGVHIPLVGLGTSGADVGRLEETLRTAFKCGYRLVDTAVVYGNHAAIGEALQKVLPEISLAREEVTVVTKVQLGKENCAKVVEDQVRKALFDLRLEYIDVVLIHYPTYATLDDEAENYSGNKEIRLEGYKTLLKLRDLGLIKSVGVSNFEAIHLAEFEAHGLAMPTMNQVEYHPLFLRTDLIQYCRMKNIFFQAFSSLANFRPDLADSEILKEIMGRTGRQRTGILLSFATSQGIGVIPKSNTPIRIETNFEEAYKTLSIDDINALKLLNKYSEGSVVKRCRGWKCC
ncbi:unnamed protein product, partial [Mesorhabditis spiculigera]